MSDDSTSLPRILARPANEEKKRLMASGSVMEECSLPKQARKEDKRRREAMRK